MAVTAAIRVTDTFAAGARGVVGLPHSPGDIYRTADKEYVFVQADGAITGAGYVVIIDEAYQADMITNTTGLFGQKVGVAQATFADNEYGWVQINGVTDIRVAASAAANAQLTTTTTNGQLDDAAGAGTKNITGLALTTSNGGSAATAPGVLTYPVVGATN